MLTIAIACTGLVVAIVALRRTRTLMADVQNLSEDLDVITAGVLDLVAEVEELREAIKDVVTPEQLDALDAKTEALKTLLAGPAEPEEVDEPESEDDGA